MTKRFAFPLVLVPCVVLAASLSTFSALGDAASDWTALEKQYAEANYQLAAARLAVAESQNKAVAGSVTKETIDELTSGVQVARDQVKQLLVNKTANSVSPRVTAAEGQLKALEVDHTESLKANQLQAGSVPAVELQREEAEINVAKARLAALRALPQQSPQVRVEWEIRMLQDDIRALWARPLIED